MYEPKPSQDEVHIATLKGFNCDELLVTVQFATTDPGDDNAPSLDLDFRKVPLIFWQCWKYFRWVNQVRLYFNPLAGGDGLELQRIEPLENATLWSMCLDSARKEMRAVEKGKMCDELRRRERWSRGTLGDVSMKRSDKDGCTQRWR